MNANTSTNTRIGRIGSTLGFIAFGIVVGFLASACGSKSGSSVGQLGQGQAQAEPAATATKWEYKSVNLDRVDNYDKGLNDNTAGGWELTQMPSVKLAIYRRPKAN